MKSSSLFIELRDLKPFRRLLRSFVRPHWVYFCVYSQFISYKLLPLTACVYKYLAKMMDDKQRFSKANECAVTSEGQLNDYGVPEIMDCLACNKGVKI